MSVNILFLYPYLKGADLCRDSKAIKMSLEMYGTYVFLIVDMISQIF